MFSEISLQLFDEWYVLLLAMHYEGKSWVKEYSDDIDLEIFRFKITINGTKEVRQIFIDF
jgi:hypothetical protein